ncbi:MAG: DUF2703 domain-containing protein [Bradymonadaceae bacterium]
MQIEILCIDGCPHVDETRELVGDVVAQLGVEADIETVEVSTDRQARELDFRGSPSVRVDGTDIQPDVDERTTVGRGCRVYSTSDGTSGVPPKEMVASAVHEA